MSLFKDNIHRFILNNIFILISKTVFSFQFQFALIQTDFLRQALQTHFGCCSGGCPASSDATVHLLLPGTDVI